MNVIQEIQRINQIELDNGYVNTSASWHNKYANSAWVYVGNIPLQLTEGDVLCVMSQWGEIEDIHLVRDNGHDGTGKSRGFGFVKYEDSRSCILAVDNFCGIKILNRSIRVDHVEKYRLPKHLQKKEDWKNGDEKTIAGGIRDKDEKVTDYIGPGHAYRGIDLANCFDMHNGHDLFISSISQ